MVGENADKDEFILSEECRAKTRRVVLMCLSWIVRTATVLSSRNPTIVSVPKDF